MVLKIFSKYAKQFSWDALMMFSSDSAAYKRIRPSGLFAESNIGEMHLLRRSLFCPSVATMSAAAPNRPPLIADGL